MNEIQEKDPPTSTRTRLLDTAEQLFAEQGVEATSVQDIVKAAETNPGMINHHFRSHNLLVLEVFARQLRKVNQQRLARLAALEAGQAAPSLEEVLQSLIRPTVEDEIGGRHRTNEFMRLIVRSFQEPGKELKIFMAQEFGEIVRRFDAAILRAVPGLVNEEPFWRMSFLFGALYHGLEQWSRLDSVLSPPELDCARRRLYIEGFIQRFIAYVAAGMRAAAVQSSPYSFPS